MAALKQDYERQAERLATCERQVKSAGDPTPDGGAAPLDLGPTVVGGLELSPRPSQPVRNAFVANGVETGAAKCQDECFADVVALLRAGKMECTGVLLTKNLVLTARHCRKVDTVLAGTSVESARARANVRTAVTHPSALVDAMLLKVDDVELPCKHDRRRSDQREPPDGAAVIVGFGASDHRGRDGATTARCGHVDLAGWSCSVRSRSRTGCWPSHELVVAGGASDTCAGDSGGALFERVGSAYRLVGITARALPSRGAACGQGGVYTRVDVIAPWIAAEIGKVEK